MPNKGKLLISDSHFWPPRYTFWSLIQIVSSLYFSTSRNRLLPYFGLAICLRLDRLILCYKKRTRTRTRKNNKFKIKDKNKKRTRIRTRTRTRTRATR